MKVLVSDPIHEDGLEKLKEFAEVDVSTDLDKKSLIEKIPEFDAMVVRSGTTVDGDVLDAASKLKIIARAGVGLDNIDLEHADDLGIRVVNTPEAPSISVAELVIGYLIAWSRNLIQANNSLKDKKWVKSKLLGTELKSKTLGVIGTGNIGEEVAKRANAFGMNLLGHDIYQKEELEEMGLEYVELDELLTDSDFITIHTPLNSSTRHMIGEKEFKKMKNNAVIANASRGAVIDEEALLEALENETIGGACLDVFEKDPLDNERLLENPNVILTPHIGSQTKENQRNVGVMAAEKIKEELT
jgi:D-3-phosphoglycerate dehydrogenase